MCDTPITGPKMKIPEMCLLQFKYHLIECTFSRILVYN